MKPRRRNAEGRGPNLSDDDINTIVKIIDVWDGKLTWATLKDEVAKRLHWEYCRQTLYKHERIRLAFDLRRQAIRQRPATKAPTTSLEMQVAYDNIASLEAKNARLEAENQQLLEQFAVWAYNARIWGMDAVTLNQPLPSVTFR